MEKTEWPTPAKVKELRQQGLFPYSPFTTTCLISASLLLACLLTYDTWMEMIAAYRDLVVVWDDPLSPGINAGEPAERFFSALRVIIFTGAISAIIAALLSILGQSRFLISFINFRMDLSRLNSFAVVFSGGFGGVLLKGIVCAILALLVGGLLFWWSSFELFGLYNKPSSSFLNWPVTFYKRIWPVLLVFFIFAGAVSYWIVWYSFMRRHRMSTREIESDVE